MDETSGPYRFRLSVTHLQLRSWRHLLPFLWQTLLILRQLRRAKGCREVRMRQLTGLQFGTLTLWDSEQAMRAFQTSGAHLRAMRAMPAWSVFSETGGWQVSADVLPSWDEIDRDLARLRSNGYWEHFMQRRDFPLPVAEDVKETG